MKIETNYRSPNFSAGRPAGKPNTIVIHHWGSDGQNFDNVAKYLCRANGNSSAHYVVQAGRVAELVSPENRAWHAGVKGNPRGIGIECRPEMSDADIEEVCQLVAHLRRRYGALTITKHADYMATTCPSRWAIKLDYIDKRANEINNPTPTPAPAAAALEVDGVMGLLTVKALQKWLGTTVDGFFSSQPLAARAYWPACTVIETSSQPRGSRAVRALQKVVGCKVDGFLGPDTAGALQNFLNVKDGAGLEVDGVAGKLTAKSLQRWLNKVA